MANIESRAYASLTDDERKPTAFEKAYQRAILELIRTEFHATLSHNDALAVEEKLISPLQEFYSDTTNDTAHFHLPPDRAVTVTQWPLLGAQGKLSYPMFNVYDLLAVAHSVLTKKYGFLPISAGVRANKPIDKPIPFMQIPKPGKEGLRSENITQIMESLRNCCNAFSVPKNGKKPRTQSMPAMAGYSMPLKSIAARPLYPSFDVVTAGTTQQKAEIIAARLARFSQAFQNAAQAMNAANWVCGNCAEQAYWPVPGDEQTEYEGITIVIRNFEGDVKIAPGRSAENCPNCQAMAQHLATEGFVMKDLAALGRPPIPPGQQRVTVSI